MKYNGMEWNGAERNIYSILFVSKVNGTKHVIIFLFHFYP